MTRLKLVLLYGGQSGEHEVSLQSAASVLANLDSNQYDVLPVGMDKQGCLYLNSAAELIQNYPDALPVKLASSEKLSSLMSDGKLSLDADVVFPVMHGPLCEDGALQGVFDLADIAYVGCNLLSSAISMDKDIARQLAVVEGIESIRYHRLPHSSSAAQDKTWCEAAAKDLGFPLFVKPCALGSSVGIHRAENMSELLLAVQDARLYDRVVLIEEYIEGREIELAVLEHDGAEGVPDVSVPGEIQSNHPDGFYSYAAKYTECEQLKLCIPAVLDTNLTRKLQMAAAEIFMCLRAAGLARVDFFVQDNKNKIYFNEMNTLPGFTTVSMFPKLWEASGLNYPALLDRLIQSALRRHSKRSALITDCAGASQHVTG
jgi:D-alanine-D-alanine ligase